ncbi:MAG: FliA/WhiG family RNA polymerase sigma factor [Desulfovibrio sp.]|jgi:RNA polymerase sigma factor for flagellar operon FliA|nr:FliA/WhiG family RNA polymerase sigma factor [Desulfovibrio sp.]
MPSTATSSFSGSACSSAGSSGAAWERFCAGLLAWPDCTGGQQEDIVRHFAPKVKYLALRLKSRLPRNVELADLIGAGTLGLMESFGKFRPDMGIKFDTYAENRIRGAMLDELRQLDWFPRSLRKKVRMLDEAVQKLEHEGGESPNEEALAAETGLDVKEVREGLEAMNSRFTISLDLILESFAGMEGAGADEAFSSVSERELIDRVAELIEQLTAREKLVLSLYYADELNMRETAEVMGITEGRVSQLHSQALTRLRREFTFRHGKTSLP